MSANFSHATLGEASSLPQFQNSPNTESEQEHSVPSIEAARALQEICTNLEIAQVLTHLGSWRLDIEDLDSFSFSVAFMSAEMYRILGITPQSAPPSRELWLQCLHPDDRVPVMHAFEEVMQAGEIYMNEHRVVRPDGEIRDVLIRAQLERDDHGTPVCINGTTLDVSVTKQDERVWQAPQQQLLTVLNSLPIVLWALDKNGVFTLSEGSALEKIGLKSGEVVGKTIWDVYGKVPKILEMAREALSGRQTSSQIQVGELLFQTLSHPILGPDGEILGAVGASQDVTEHSRTRRELSESQARWARLVGNIPGAVFRFEAPLLANGRLGPGHFSSMSGGCLEIFGVLCDSALESCDSIFSCFTPACREAMEANLEKSARELSRWFEEVEIAQPDGDRRWVRLQGRPFRRENGVTVWDGLIVDVTETVRAQEELSQSRRALDEAQNLAHVGSFRLRLATHELFWSSETYRIFGETRENFQPNFEAVMARIHPEDAPRVSARWHEVLAQKQDSVEVIRVIRPDGSVRVVEVRTRCELDEKGEVIELVGSAQDVTERVEAECALRESEERYALAALGANDGLWDWNLQSDTIYFSPRWKAMIGFGDGEISDHVDEWLGRVHPEDAPRLRAEMRPHIESPGELFLPAPEDFGTGKRHAVHFEAEYRLRARDGSYRSMLARGVSIRDQEGRPAHFAGSQTDITERRAAQELLERHAFYDSLTGLPNRALFLIRLEQLLTRASGEGEQPFAVLFLDLDRFKKINDSLGHSAGDLLLVEAARRFEKCLRGGDTVARLGGDEFAVLLCDLGEPDEVPRVARRIQEELQRPFILEGRELFVTVSIGIVSTSDAELRADELLRNADTAMYRAKDAGRARYELFDTSMHQRAVRLLELESDLWRAIEREELRLFYQPVIALESGEIVGVEALVRWQHPKRGLVSPNDFIPLAEETGLIVPMGWWIFREVCTQARHWKDAGYDLFVAANFSSKQFSQPDVKQQIAEILRETDAPIANIKIEITESVLVENAENAAATLLELQSLGLGLSLDDFGTGYSSLSYLHRFPIDTLKIDRSFISRLGSVGRDSQIINTILALGHGLQLQVVAEGVETATQFTALRELGCGLAQGYYFARPLPLDEIEKLLASKPIWRVGAGHQPLEM